MKESSPRLDRLGSYNSQGTKTFQTMSQITRRTFLQDTILTGTAVAMASIPISTGDPRIWVIVGRSLNAPLKPHEFIRLSGGQVASVWDPNLILGVTSEASAIEIESRTTTGLQQTPVVLERNSIPAAFIGIGCQGNGLHELGLSDEDQFVRRWKIFKEQS